MKAQLTALLLITLLAVSILSGCSPNAVEAQLDRAEDAIENRLDAAEQAAKSPTSPKPVPPEQPKVIDESRLPLADKPVPTPALTKADAEAIALAHANFTRDQVKFLRTEYEFDDGVYQYDVEFLQGRWEYNYEIHAETSAILSIDKDD